MSMQSKFNLMLKVALLEWNVSRSAYPQCLRLDTHQDGYVTHNLKAIGAMFFSPMQSINALPLIVATFELKAIECILLVGLLNVIYYLANFVHAQPYRGNNDDYLANLVHAQLANFVHAQPYRGNNDDFVWCFKVVWLLIRPICAILLDTLLILCFYSTSKKAYLAPLWIYIYALLVMLIRYVLPNNFVDSLKFYDPKEYNVYAESCTYKIWNMIFDCYINAMVIMPVFLGSYGVFIPKSFGLFVKYSAIIISIIILLRLMIYSFNIFFCAIFAQSDKDEERVEIEIAIKI